MQTLTAEQAKAFYDRFGSKQDMQAFYERRALQTLCARAALPQAHAIFEFGCGTGALALELFDHHLPTDARYLGTDLSGTMVALARQRLARFGSRASVAEATAQPSVPLPSSTVDRFISTYVLDLLAPAQQQQVLREAGRVLKPDGLLCLAGITEGTTPMSKLVMGAWQRVFAWAPSLLGGCRPCRSSDYLRSDDWRVVFRTVVVAWGVATEVVIAAVGHPAASRG